jgi:hypothetical protein
LRRESSCFTPPQRPPRPRHFPSDIAAILELQEERHAVILAHNLGCTRCGAARVRRAHDARLRQAVSVYLPPHIGADGARRGTHAVAVLESDGRSSHDQERLYEGNLTFYFRTLFFKSSNIYNPYHNFRRMLHVLWLCDQACRYYQNRLTPRQMRNLLIAALFHDFDHPGHPHPSEGDPDRINIPIAIAGLRRYVMRRSRLFGQLSGRNKLKGGSRLLVSPFPEIKFIPCCCGVL